MSLPGGGLRCEGYWGASGSPSSLSIPMLCQYSCHVLNKAEPSFISSKYIVLATNSCSHFPCECCAQCLVQTGEGERKNAIGKTVLSDTVIDVSLVQEVSLAHMEHFWWIQAQTLWHEDNRTPFLIVSVLWSMMNKFFSYPLEECWAKSEVCTIKHMTVASV